MVLIKGQGATSNANGIKSYKMSDMNVDAWFTGNFVFEGTDLNQVIQSLNTYYNNRFVLAEDYQKTCKLTASFNKVPIEEVVEVLTLSCNLTVLNEKDRYVLK
ncbi:MAG: DUF4974 domain-containing protein [Saprospiraceae bacterium]|nr:DUF4974 domain-containing protein [Saprospiraceae bacterium]